MNRNIGFIGAGKMASALIEGLLHKKVMARKDVLISDCDRKRVRYFRSQSIHALTNTELVKRCDMIFLCVKPIHVPSVCEEITGLIKPRQVLVSIAAGITLGFLERYLGNGVQIVRVMPNTPSLVARGMSVYCFNDRFDRKNRKLLERMLSSVGEVLHLEEKYFDAVTGLSGSGPAYIFVVINALAEGGLRMGLPKSISLKLAAQTVLGSAELVLRTGRHPLELKDMVSSPGGTTVEGLKVLEDHKVRSAFIEAVEKAALRSKNLIKE